MEAVCISAGTRLEVCGVWVRLAMDTLVEVAYEDMHVLTGYHYAHVPDSPQSDPQGASRPGAHD